MRGGGGGGHPVRQGLRAHPLPLHRRPPHCKEEGKALNR